MAPPHLKEAIIAYCRYLDDPSVYPTNLPQPKPQTTGLSREDERLLGDRYTRLECPPLATTYGFKVAEIEKQRWRLCHQSK